MSFEDIYEFFTGGERLGVFMDIEGYGRGIFEAIWIVYQIFHCLIYLELNLYNKQRLIIAVTDR